MKHLIIILLSSFSLLSDSKETNTGIVLPVRNKNPNFMITEGQSLLKEGDLVVRLNRDPTSQFIKYFNRHDKSYSHSGIVLFENGYPYIFHIVNGQENPGEKLRKDSLSRFCNPRNNSAYGIFRYEMNAGEIKVLKDLIHKWYDNGVRFDTEFNLKTDDRMYCSEMISKVLQKATAKRIMIEPTKLTTIEARLFSTHTHLSYTYTSTLKIISIDNLYMNPFCHLINAYAY
jgi:hypothetical protein